MGILFKIISKIIIFEISSEAPPYIIFAIGIAIISLQSSYALFYVKDIKNKADALKQKKGIFTIKTWQVLLFSFIMGLLFADIVYIMFATPIWWQLLIKCLLILVFSTLFFLITEVFHFIRDVSSHKK